MLLNISYNDPAINRRIEKAVGAPFTLQQRLKMKGIGSQKLNITSCSVHIHNLLILDQNINSCNIELRPKGIILNFRSLLETYGLVISYYKLETIKKSRCRCICIGSVSETDKCRLVHFHA